LRLPLQHGFAWLNGANLQVTHERYELSASQALDWFVADLTNLANTYRDFHKFKAHVEQLQQKR
jgi:hypothetical protein